MHPPLPPTGSPMPPVPKSINTLISGPLDSTVTPCQIHKTTTPSHCAANVPPRHEGAKVQLAQAKQMLPMKPNIKGESLTQQLLHIQRIKAATKHCLQLCGTSQSTPLQQLLTLTKAFITDTKKLEATNWTIKKITKWLNALPPITPGTITPCQPHEGYDWIPMHLWHQPSAKQQTKKFLTKKHTKWATIESDYYNLTIHDLEEHE